MVYPRQKLYDTNHFGYLKRLISGTLNKTNDNSFSKAFYDLTKIENAIPMSRGRLGLYFAIKYFICENKKSVIMNSFTIFDVINMVVIGGGKPVFCDSESVYSPHITLEEIKSKATSDTAVVIITHYHTVNPYIEEIAQWCKENDVKLIEDCAISFGSFKNGKAVGSFGDSSYFSFGLFKFVSTYFGGAVWFKDTSYQEKVKEELESWDRMGEKDLRSYFLKGIKLDILTSKSIFNYFTFPLFKLGYLNNITFIKNQAANDPEPHSKNELPEYYKKRPSVFQEDEFQRQFKNIKENKKRRLENAKIYYDILSSNENISISEVNESDSYLTFPIIIKNKNRDEVVCSIMKENCDAAIYFYRNCADLDCFKKYFEKLPNIEKYGEQLITLPLYPSIEKEYIKKLANIVNRITQ